MESITVNQREYRLSDRPVAVICADGCAGEYLSLGFAHGELPHLAKLAANGHFGLARGALPSFTNVNNCAMVTGTPPSQTGIGGNYILDPDTGEEVMTNSSRFLRNETILAAASAAGRKVAMVTAKDKLRELLSKGMDGIAVSAEKADDVSLEVNGIGDVESLVGAKPSIYSGEASLYALRVGVELLAAGRADFLYLSLTDYIQHKYAPHEEGALEFYQALDVELGRLIFLRSRRSRLQRFPWCSGVAWRSGTERIRMNVQGQTVKNRVETTRWSRGIKIAECNGLLFFPACNHSHSGCFFLCHNYLRNKCK